VLLIEKTETLEEGINIPMTSELERILEYLIKKSTNQFSG
jgi:hypothetical protein